MMNGPSAPSHLLDIRDLTVTFDRRTGPPLQVLHGVSLQVAHGETLGVVGESRCGKSTLALAVMRLVQKPAGRIAGGTIKLDDEDLVALSDREMRARRGRDLGMIFQEPLTSLNPVYTIGDQIEEVLRRHRSMTRREATDRAEDLLRLLQFPDPRDKLGAYPFQLSGGMRQRVMIAIALACEPKLLLADEPTTALDVTVQAQIFDLLRETRPERTGMVLITHDFGAIAEMADRVAVLYAGHKVEEGSVHDVITNPAHPYTRGLLSCMPDLGGAAPRERGGLTEIDGTVPSLTDPPPGCPFAPRCRFAWPKCTTRPPESGISPGHAVACWLNEEHGA